MENILAKRKQTASLWDVCESTHMVNILNPRIFYSSILHKNNFLQTAKKMKE